jgi:non-ribosomal peptide synthetase component E (peptide arylation enzyme)
MKIKETLLKGANTMYILVIFVLLRVKCHWVLLILATQETEISRIAVSSQPRQTVCETLS